MDNSNHYKQITSSLQSQITNTLLDLLPPENTPPTQLHQALHYIVNTGGKRIRPILLIAASQCFPSKLDPLPAAAAIEALHISSLIHDDLPCIDNSPMRRGHPTLHTIHDEASALLAGNSLLTYAFQFLSQSYQSNPITSLSLIQTLAIASGSKHLIGGQFTDIASSRNPKNIDNPSTTLDFIHSNKTASMITASILMGLSLSNQPNEILSLAKSLGHHLGMAFQIIDDILDLTADSSQTGKPTGQNSLDIQNHTLTYPALHGLEHSKQQAQEHTQKALAIADQINGNNAFLKHLIQELQHRIA